MSRAAAQVHRQARHQLSSDRAHSRHPPSAFNQSLLLHDTRQTPAPPPRNKLTKTARRTSLPPSLDTVRELVSPDRRAEPPLPAELEPAGSIPTPRFSFRSLFRRRGKEVPRHPGHEATGPALHQVSEEADEPRTMEWLVYRYQSRSATSLHGTTTGTAAADPTFVPTEGAFTPYQYQKYSLAWQQSQHRKKAAKHKPQPNAGGSVSLTDLLSPQPLVPTSSTHSLPLTQAAARRPRSGSAVQPSRSSHESAVQPSRSRHDSVVTFETNNRPASIRSVRFAEGEGDVLLPRAPSFINTSLAADADPPPTPRGILRSFSMSSASSLVPDVLVENTAVATDSTQASFEIERVAAATEKKASIDPPRRPSMTKSIESTLAVPEPNVAPPKRRRRSSQSSVASPKLRSPNLSITTSTVHGPGSLPKSSPVGSSASLQPEYASVFASSPTSPTSSFSSLPNSQTPRPKLSRKWSPGSFASFASGTEGGNSPPSAWNSRNTSTASLLPPLKGLSLPTIPSPSEWEPIKRLRRGSSTSANKSLEVKMAEFEEGVYRWKFIRRPNEKPDKTKWGPRPLQVGPYDFARGPGEAKRFREENEQRPVVGEEDTLPPRPTSARSLYVYDWTRNVSNSVPWERDNASTFSLPVFSSPWTSDRPSPTDTVVALPFDKDKELPPLPVTEDGSETERSTSPAFSDCSLHRNLNLPKPKLPYVPEYITDHERRLAKMAARADKRLSAQVAVHSRGRQRRSSTRGRGSARRTLSAPPISDAASDAATINSDRPEFDARHRTQSHQLLSSFDLPQPSPPASTWSSIGTNSYF